MDILIGIIVFLAIALAVFVVATVIFSAKCAEMREIVELCENETNQSREDVADLLSEKKELFLKNEELQAENDRLVSSYRELVEINKQLRNAAPIDEQPELYYEPEIQNYSEKKPVIDWTFDRLPDGYTNTFRCEDYRRLNDEKSEQYLLQQECITAAQQGTGMRYYRDGNIMWYCAALATAYGVEIGSAYYFTLENGTVIPVIMADYKHDISKPRADDFGDPDVNYDQQLCTNIIEFVVDMPFVPSNVISAGTMSALPEFGGLYGTGGNIVKVEYKGRVWKP